ncbi:MAG: hypothetical protein ABMA64_12500 [Myxococcota bacterium]
MRGDDTDEPLSIQRIEVAGLNESLAEELSNMPITLLAQLGVSVYLDGDVFANLPEFQGTVAFGGNSTGETFVHGSPAGKGWLQYYGLRQKSPVSGLEPGDPVEIGGGEALAQQGARRVLDEDLLHQPMDQIEDPASGRVVPVTHG